uniref:Nucleotidyltransferase family protein n=1 Tax=Ignisphaera aggregans TaxID=334771 RepID=A0A7J3YTE2_9CREN
MRIDSSMLLNALLNAVKTVSAIVKDPKAVRLLRLVGDGDYAMLDDYKVLITYAYINKVLTLLLHQEPPDDTLRALRVKLLRQRKNFLVHLQLMIELFDKCHVDYVVFKTLRPVPETPVDIDMVVGSKDDAFKAIDCLKQKFHVEIWDVSRYSIGIRIAELKEFVDFYIKPHVADLVYMDSKPLIENAFPLHINELGIDMRVPIPKPEIEFCTILAHSVIKERLVTLNDVLSLATYESLSGWNNIAEWLLGTSLSSSYNAFLKALKKPLPTKIDHEKWLVSLISIMQKSYAVKSLPFFMTNAHKRLKRLIEFHKRTTYVRGLNR